jgi:mono/diheme cytochrome c family protein
MTRWALPVALGVWAAAVAAVPAQQQALSAPTDLAAVERGQALMTAQCGFCHGSNARGGASGGPDLTRSEIVQLDEGGRQLAEFLRLGRPERGMPKFEMPDAQFADLAAFLHAQIYYASNRRLYKILDILVGDPKAGEAFFNGAGGCHKCHTTTGAPGAGSGGDLKGIASKYTDPAVLQGRMLLPRNAPPGTPPTPAHRLPNALRVTVTSPSGESTSGTLVRLTDFEVTLFDPKTEQMRSWLRSGDVPKVVVTDRLQAHMDLLMKWTDATMHDVTAYLATLK